MMLGPLVRSWRSDHAREGGREGGMVMSECDTNVTPFQVTDKELRNVEFA